MPKFEVKYDATLVIEVEAQDDEEARTLSESVADEVAGVLRSCDLPDGATELALGSAYLVYDVENDQEILCG